MYFQYYIKYMPAKRYIVSLTGDERQSLEKLIRTGN
jgi:hypothetical protein